MTSPRVLVVSACSKSKSPGVLLPTSDRYAGRAHIRVRDTIERWRQARPADDVSWSIVSAGVGLVDEHKPIPDYDATFAGLSPSAAAAHGRQLGIPEALRDRLQQADVALFVLSMTYLQAAAAPFEQPSTRIYFASPRFVDLSSGATVVPCGVDDARALGVAAREVAAVRFEQFVDERIKRESEIS